MGLNIKKNAKNNLWEWRARVSINGKQRERSGHEKVKGLAEEKGTEVFASLLKAKRQEEQHSAFTKYSLFEHFLLDWFKVYKLPALKKQTADNRQGFINDHILPALGHLQLHEINRLFYQKFINGLPSAGLSSGSIKILNSIVNSCLEYACFDLRIIEYNPANKIRIPETATIEEKKQDEINKYYTENQLEALYADDGELKVIYDLCQLMADTGLRLGEATGLLEGCYQEETQSLLIDKQLLAKSNRTNPSFGPPKTAESERVIYLDDDTNTLIKSQILKNKKFRLAHPELAKKYHFIFNRIGYPILQNSFRETLRRICARTGVPYHDKHPAHAFRHTHVKRMVEAGISTTAIQQRVGHAKGSKITVSYTHADEVMRAETIRRYADYKKTKNF
ncbi:site-specific integrase [Listeria monocytogenes]|nr:site-specific integrase [Listeria monocytogenes]